MLGPRAVLETGAMPTLPGFPSARAPRTPIEMTHDEIKQKLVLAGKVLVAEGQDDFTRGHISMRLPDDPTRFLMKPHSVGLDELTMENILTLDLDGNVLAGAARRPSEGYTYPANFQAPPGVRKVVPKPLPLRGRP